MWLGVEIRHLAALKAVAEAGSFVGAAQRLGYAQPTVSQQIATLERLVGTRLVDRARGASSVSLTPAGETLCRHAAAIVARFDAARSDIEATKLEVASALRVGYFQSLGGSILPAVLGDFARLDPDAAVQLELGDAVQLQQERVAAGELDFAFVSAPLRVEGLETLQLLDDPFVLLAPPAEVERGAEPDYDRLPLLAFKPCGVQRTIEDQLLREGLPAGRLVWIEDAKTIQALVAAGCAYGLLPRLAVDRPELARRTIDSPRRTILLVWQRDRDLSTAARAFIASTKAAFAAYGPDQTTSTGRSRPGNGSVAASVSTASRTAR
jgi:molybdate transport repressor ModE-like protein